LFYGGDKYWTAKKDDFMNLKELGKTGFSLPDIGLGTWAYRGSVEPLRKAIALGVRLVDTAESYGTEEAVGEAIKDIRDQVFIATKASPLHFRRSDLLRAADQSLQRLRIDHIDLYQLHFPNYTVPIEETMGAMEELVEMGKVKFIGVSNFPVADLKKAQAALTKHKIVSNQVRYSLVDRSIEVNLLKYCQEHDITVIAYSPLAAGMEHIKMNDPSNVLGKVATLTGKTEAQVALNWCISKEKVIAIPKANSLDRFFENCSASGWMLSPQQIELLDKGIRFRRRGPIEAALRRMGRRFVQRFGYTLF
jgi:diketogulonate reductase-like aldo/keto reductase